MGPQHCGKGLQERSWAGMHVARTCCGSGKSWQRPSQPGCPHPAGHIWFVFVAVLQLCVGCAQGSMQVQACPLPGRCCIPPGPSLGVSSCRVPLLCLVFGEGSMCVATPHPLPAHTPTHGQRSNPLSTCCPRSALVVAGPGAVAVFLFAQPAGLSVVEQCLLAVCLFAHTPALLAAKGPAAAASVAAARRRLPLSSQAAACALLTAARIHVPTFAAGALPGHSACWHYTSWWGWHPRRVTGGNTTWLVCGAPATHEDGGRGVAPTQHYV
jgi:hypothetical protein